MSYSAVNPKTGRTLFLHKYPNYTKGKADLYVFSYEIVGAVDLPEHLDVVFNKENGHPYVVKKGKNYEQAKGIDYW